MGDGFPLVEGLEELLADGDTGSIFDGIHAPLDLGEHPESFLGAMSTPHCDAFQPAPPEAAEPACCPLHPAMFAEHELASWVTEAGTSWLPNEIIERILRCSQLPTVLGSREKGRLV